jgi:hypothetical protein
MEAGAENDRKSSREDLSLSFIESQQTPVKAHGFCSGMLHDLFIRRVSLALKIPKPGTPF